MTSIKDTIDKIIMELSEAQKLLYRIRLDVVNKKITENISIIEKEICEETATGYISATNGQLMSLQDYNIIKKIQSEPAFD